MRLRLTDERRASCWLTWASIGARCACVASRDQREIEDALSERITFGEAATWSGCHGGVTGEGKEQNLRNGVIYSPVSKVDKPSPL